MKEKDSNNNLTDHIRETLLEHEEPYVLGSWERFQKHSQQKVAVRRRKIWYAAAASFLLLISAAVAWNNWPTLPEQQLATTETEPSPQNDAPLPSNQDNAPATQQQDQQSVVVGKPVLEAPSSATLQSMKTVADVPETPQNITQAGIDRAEAGIYNIQLTANNEGLAYVPPSTLKSLSKEPSTQAGNFAERSSLNLDSLLLATDQSSLPVVMDISSPKKLTFSAGYASVVNIHNTQTDLGMGGGFYTDWNFSKRLSLSSGLFIAQNQLKYEQIPAAAEISRSEAESAFNISSPAGPYLTYMQLDLVNLEIPLNLKLQVSDHFSISAGISSLTFLKEDYNYVYEYQKNVQVNDRNIASDVEPVTQTVTLQTSLTQSEPSLERIDWAAFYTFSFGYDRPFLGDTHASLEPFVKIPAGQVTSMGVRYTTGGLQLKISF